MADIRFLEDLCTVFYETTNCPISMYCGTTLRLSVPEDPFSFVSFHQRELWEKPGVSYVCSDTNLFFARIPVEDSPLSLVVGPFVMDLMSNEYVDRVIDEYHIISYAPEIVADYLRIVASGVFSKAAALVRLLYFLLTRRLPGYYELFSTIPVRLQNQINRQHTDALMQAREEEEYHNSYNFERMIYARLQSGDVDFFLRSSTPAQYKIGKMADSSLRQAKNTFIVNVALATRSAVAGGLDEETAYHLSDEYIQTVEKMISLDSIDQLSRAMLVDFTERVRNTALPLSDIPEDINRAVKYVRMHTNSNLSVQEVAEAVGLSRSHLSHKFKSIMGFDINSFIMRCKLEEARSLLMYSEQSIIEISNYLCFSSQSYFTNVFHKKYGLTPKEFRLKNEKKFIL
ncbi:MAG: helix-turn-helix domain-containing protein [Clostridia bacterium]|nr:helix-turn-helix domain-containing protein [Clostridia bacterium]